MKKSFWDKKIPTLLGLFILSLGIGITTFLTNSQTFLKTNASTSEQPQNVRITNISDTSFSVSYSTLDKISGSLNYGQNISLGQSAFDERNQNSQKITNYQIHNITLNNLLPLTKYYFTIISGQNTYYNSGKPFEVITGPSISKTANTPDLIKGKLILPNGIYPSEAIIYITLDNSQVLSALAKPDGTYELPLTLIRSGDLSSYYNFNQNSIIKMLIYGDSLTSNVVLSKKQINPVPLITLSKDYNFQVQDLQSTNASTSLQGFPSFESTSSASQKVQILTPQKNQELTDSKPLFKGTAGPNENVKIIIHSDQTIQTQIKTDKNGNWSFTPSEALTPGTHTITITSKDVSGLLKTITQSFVVYASGTQIPNASGSPTPTPTTTPTIASAIPTPTDIPPAFPSLTPSPTPILVQAPVSTSSSTLLPPTGNPFIIIFGIFGIIVSLIGSLLFILSRKTFNKL